MKDFVTSPAPPERRERERPLPLRLPDFRRLLLARACGAMALQAQAVLIGWQVYKMTGDVFMLGLIGLTEALPAIACALVAGHVADNNDPKKLLLTMFGAIFFNTVFLLLVIGAYLPLPGPVLLPAIFVAIAVSGLLRGFYAPSFFILVSRIVDKSDMPQAAAWNGSTFQLSALAGPAVAGLLLASPGAETVAWLWPVCLIAFSFVMAALLRSPPAPFHRPLREPAIKSIVAGWRYMLSNQTLMSMMLLDMFAVMFGGALAMLPAYADRVLGVGADGLGLLRASPAAGSVLVALVLALRPMRFISARKLLVVAACYGLTTLGLGLSSVFWVSALLLALGGAFDIVSVIIRGTMMQLLAPEDMRGRLSSINSMFIISSNEIGSFVQGTTARLLGLVPGIIFGGCMTVGIALATALLAPRFRRTLLDSENPPVIPQTTPAVSAQTEKTGMA